MKQVLVVDDNDDIRLLLHLLLLRELKDCEVVEASSGLQAMQLVHEFKFDLIISDFVMPYGSGEDLFRFVRKTGLPIPFIFYSGSPPSIETRMELGDNNCRYIEKPEFKLVVKVASQMIH